MSFPQPGLGPQSPTKVPSRLPQAKVYGGVGSILLLLAIVPYAGVVLAILGLVFILISLKYISDEVGEPRIFRYSLYSFIAGVAGIAILVLIVISAFMASFMVMRPGQPQIVIISSPTLPQHGMQQSWVFQNGLLGLILAVLGALIASWAALIISSIFLKTSYDAVAKNLGVGLFSTVAILYIVGSVLLIVFLIGLLIIFVGITIQIIAFFSIPENIQRSQGQLPTPP